MQAQSSQSYRSSGILTIVLVAVASATFGCGKSDGITRYDLSGTITFAGKPLEKGAIQLFPDPAQGNQGPAVSLGIVDGRYETKTGEGTVGGSHKIKIYGYQPIPLKDLKGSIGNLLFPVYEVTVDIPKEEATKDFDIPESHGERVKLQASSELPPPPP